MSKEKSIQIIEFENIVQLIHDARNRAFSKVNEELVMLYFNVGQVVSVKVAGGIWGERTIDELANHIAVKLPCIGGFNRRGLYRMKQFYETYSVGSDFHYFWLNVQAGGGQTPFMPPTATQIETAKNKDDSMVSPFSTLLQDIDNQNDIFVSSVMTQISWTNHLMILSKTKTPEEKLFYLLLAKNEKLSVRELNQNLVDVKVSELGFVG